MYRTAFVPVDRLKKAPITTEKPVVAAKPAEPEAFSTKQLPIEDIDQDRENPQLVSYYAKDIYSYLRKLEVRFFVTSMWRVFSPQPICLCRFRTKLKISIWMDT